MRMSKKKIVKSIIFYIMKKRGSKVNGILFINKSPDITSSDSLNIVKKRCNIPSLGHAGTLDPFATGLLIAGVKKGAKLLSYFQDLPKVYEATFALGVKTDSFDRVGNVIGVSQKKVKQEQIKQALGFFKGSIKQKPPQFSALKVNGKRAYELARNNEEFELSKRDVTVHRFEILDFDKKTQELKVLIECSKGTYIRSLANDLGESLGCFAHVKDLCRTFIGPYSYQKATVDKEVTNKDIISIKEFFSHLPKLTVKNQSLKMVLNGSPIFQHFIKMAPSQAQDGYIPSFYQIFSENDVFIAIVDNTTHKTFYIEEEALKLLS
jgi:tRNA pseudouridine55 synthase